MSQNFNWIIPVDFFWFCYLFRLYKKHIIKEYYVKQKLFLKRQKKNKAKYKCAKNRIK